MKYFEAKKKKDELEKVTFFDSTGIEYVYMVVPKNKIYFKEYLVESKNNNYNFIDDDAIPFAKDEEFKVFPLRMHRDKN